MREKTLQRFASVRLARLKRSDQPGDPVFSEQLKITDLLLFDIVGITKKQRISVLLGDIFDPSDELGEKRVRDARDHNPDRETSLRS
jgi:hypothetical protein